MSSERIVWLLLGWLPAEMCWVLNANVLSNPYLLLNDMSYKTLQSLWIKASAELLEVVQLLPPAPQPALLGLNTKTSRMYSSQPLLKRRSTCHRLHKLAIALCWWKDCRWPVTYYRDVLESGVGAAGVWIRPVILSTPSPPLSLTASITVKDVKTLLPQINFRVPSMRFLKDKLQVSPRQESMKLSHIWPKLICLTLCVTPVLATLPSEIRPWIHI